MRERYVAALCKEMEERAKSADLSQPIPSVYMGGGTPSQLTFPQLHQLFDAVRQLFPLAEDAEVTMELNPDDVTPDFVAQLRSLPVNRLSLGIQTFNDNVLTFCCLYCRLAAINFLPHARTDYFFISNEWLN